MRRFNKLTPLILWSVLLAAGQAAAQEPGFRIIVNPENPTASVSAAQVAQLFLKQTTSWSHGGKVKPVDQAETSPARIAFSEEVLSRTVNAVESYWQQQIFSGRAVPPVKVGTEADVVAYVKANPGAIGYVSPSADSAGVRIVRIDG